VHDFAAHPQKHWKIYYHRAAPPAVQSAIMPTPFTHLLTAAQFLADERIPADARAALDAERGAFLLGNIAADARVSSNLNRENTHFYIFTDPIIESPWRVMLGKYPALAHPATAAQRAFLAGYVAHLVMDEIWLLDVVRPYFVEREWGERRQRFLMLNVLLMLIDARDYALLPAWERSALLAAQPDGWVPFVTDDDLRGWRDLVGRQLPPEGSSETLAIIGERLERAPDDLRAMLDDPAYLEREVWANVPRDAVAQAEARMVEQARTQMLEYLNKT
jgi:hypothetical protein